jgi:hypothetical protein
VSPAAVADHVASFSWIAALPADRREQLMARVRALIDAVETPAEMPIHFTVGLTVARG